MTEVSDANVDARKIVDYTSVQAGWAIEGHLWTGQSTASTLICPKCGRVGVTSRGNVGKIVVHSGRVDGNTLVGIDYCTIGFDAAHKKRAKEL